MDAAKVHVVVSVLQSTLVMYAIWIETLWVVDQLRSAEKERKDLVVV